MENTVHETILTRLKVQIYPNLVPKKKYGAEKKFVKLQKGQFHI